MVGGSYDQRLAEDTQAVRENPEKYSKPGENVQRGRGKRIDVSRTI